MALLSTITPMMLTIPVANISANSWWGVTILKLTFASRSVFCVPGTWAWHISPRASYLTWSGKWPSMTKAASCPQPMLQSNRVAAGVRNQGGVTISQLHTLYFPLGEAM